MNWASVGAVLCRCVQESRPSWLMGARDFEDIAADPEASAQEIEALSMSGWAGELAAMMHPNIPASVFFDLAELYPLEAVENPSFALIVLAEPERWAALEKKNAKNWLVNTLSKRYRDGQNLWPAINLFSLKRAHRELFPWREKIPQAMTIAEEAIALLQAPIPAAKKAKQASALKDKIRMTAFPSIASMKIPDDAAYCLERTAGYALQRLALSESEGSAQTPAQAANTIGDIRSWVWAKEEGEVFEGKRAEDYSKNQAELESIVQWRQLLALLGQESRYEKVLSQVKAEYANRFRESYYGPEAKREADVQKKIKASLVKMKANTKDVVAIMNRVEEKGLSWPDYVAIGLVVGGVALVILAPEMFIVAGVAEASGMFAVRSAAVVVADEIALLSARAAVSTVTIEFNKAVALTAAQSVFVKELATKLAQTNVTVDLAKTVEAVVKVTR